MLLRYVHKHMHASSLSCAHRPLPSPPPTQLEASVTEATNTIQTVQMDVELLASMYKVCRVLALYDRRCHRVTPPFLMRAHVGNNNCPVVLRQSGVDELEQMQVKVDAAHKVGVHKTPLTPVRRR